MAIKLLGVEAIRTRMQLPESQQLDLIVQSALEGTTLYLTSALDTDLNEGTGEDLFYVDGETPELAGTVQLRLTNGHVRDVEVIVSRTLPDGVEGEVTTPLKIKDEKGLVVLPIAELRPGRYILVRYAYGFADEDSSVPDWLQEAALSYVPQLMQMNQLGDAKPSPNPVLEVVKNHTKELIKGKLRNFALSIKPLY